MDQVRCWEIIPFHRPLSRRGFTQLSHHMTHVGRMAGPIATSAFNRLHHMQAVLVHGHCYAQLAISSLAVAQTTASTYCAYPRRDGQAE